MRESLAKAGEDGVEKIPRGFHDCCRSKQGRLTASIAGVERVDNRRRLRIESAQRFEQLKPCERVAASRNIGNDQIKRVRMEIAQRKACGHCLRDRKPQPTQHEMLLDIVLGVVVNPQDRPASDLVSCRETRPGRVRSSREAGPFYGGHELRIDLPPGLLGKLERPLDATGFQACCQSRIGATVQQQRT